MKRLLSLLLMLLIVCQSTILAQSTTNHLAERDSLLASYQAMPQDTLRILKLKEELANKLGDKWAIELIDTLVKESRRVRFHNGELAALFLRCNYYAYQSDTLQMRLSFEQLGKTAEAYKDYTSYFSMWRVMGDYKSKRGETEAALLEAEQMRAKAIKLNYTSGLYYANLMKAEALGNAKRNKEALELYAEILEDKELNKYKRSEIHWRKYTIYYDMREYAAAIHEVETSLQLYREHYADRKRTNLNPHMLLQKELAFCRLYAAIPEVEKLYHHLQQSDNYYTPNTHPSLRVSYYLHWALYHHFNNELEQSLAMFDQAFAQLDGTMPLFETSLYNLKGDVLKGAKKYQLAAENYRQSALMIDSINQKIQRMHEEVYYSNYLINKDLIEKSNLDFKQNRLEIAITTLISLVLLFVLIKTVHVNLRLKRVKKKTIELLQKAKIKNKSKEAFLHNITHQIRIPLNTIVGFSELLTQEQEVTAEERIKINEVIKEDATELSDLIFNILHLSRLESGMTRLKVEAYDMVALWKNALQLVEEKWGETTRCHFTTDREKIIVETDYDQLTRVITSLLEEGIKYQLWPIIGSIKEVNPNLIKITIQTAPLMEAAKEERILQHSINHTLIRLFQGEYEIEESLTLRTIHVTIPTKQSVE
ncbi:MAG: histidine kinase dimerization/phospho-acceptor domain-containing protein [Phocaeicola sp.]